MNAAPKEVINLTLSQLRLKKCIKILKLKLDELQTENKKLKQQLHICGEPLYKNISDKIKLEIDQIEINLNATLAKTIKSASEEVVLLAIQALKEALECGNVRHPEAWLNRAIQNGWTPNKNLLQNTAEKDFKKWFDIAYSKRLVLASTRGDDGQIYVYTQNGVPLPFKQMLSEYPLEELHSEERGVRE